MADSKFKRTDNLFSLCGLNCSLCPMFIRGGCGGCFTDSPCYPTCPIAPCSVEHGNVEYCFECSEYPCPRYDGIDLHDSLISHRNQKKDLAKAKRIGIEAYKAEQREKKALLDRLMRDYKDSRRDVFYCLAVNMLEVKDLEAVLTKADAESAGMTGREKADHVERELRRLASAKGVPLELRR